MSRVTWACACDPPPTVNTLSATTLPFCCAAIARSVSLPNWAVAWRPQLPWGIPLVIYREAGTSKVTFPTPTLPPRALGDRLDPVVAVGNSRRDVPGGRHIERDVPDVDALEPVALLPLVVERDVVRRVELARGVVVHVDVHPVGKRAAGLHAELKIEDRLERRIALRGDVVELARTAALVLRLFQLGLEAAVELEAEVGLLPEEVGDAAGIGRRNR